LSVFPDAHDLLHLYSVADLKSHLDPLNLSGRFVVGRAFWEEVLEMFGSEPLRTFVCPFLQEALNASFYLWPKTENEIFSGVKGRIAG